MKASDRFFPSDPKTLKSRIQSYERALDHDDDDSYGKRYLLGPMYLLLGDVEGALKHYSWFSKKFDDDSGEPYHRLCWALALFLAKDSGAEARLYDSLFKNLYLLPHVLGIKVTNHSIKHRSNWEAPQYAESIPHELVELWDVEAKVWAKAFYERPETQDAIKRYVGLAMELEQLEAGDERSRVIDEMYEISDPQYAKKRQTLKIVGDEKIH